MTEENDDLVLTFGQHRGKHLSEVPADYLAWLAGQDIRKQPEARAAACLWLTQKQVALPTKPARMPGPPPRTYREASKLGWMAGKNYGNAKATLLAARDPDGFLMVRDEDGDEDGESRLLWISSSGMVTEAETGFSGLSYEQVKAVLSRYPLVDGQEYLVEAAEAERAEADEARRRLHLRTTDGKSEVTLIVWAADAIEVRVDGREMGDYRFREPNARERRHPRWKQAAAILEPLDHDGENIGLLPERARLVAEKIAEGKQ